MANFIITTQKPRAPEVTTNKSSTLSKGIQDAFDSLMSHKEVTPSKPLSEQGSEHHREQLMHERALHKHQKKGNQVRHNGQFLPGLLRPNQHQALQPLMITPEQLIQRQQHGGGHSGQQHQGQEQQQEQEPDKPPVQNVNEVLFDSGENGAAAIHVNTPDMQGESLSILGTIDEPVDALFEDIGDAHEPLSLGDDPTVDEALGTSMDNQDAPQREQKSDWERFNHQSKTVIVPGVDTEDVLDPETGAPRASAEESSLMAAALEKTRGHYPEGSVGRALQEGRIDQKNLRRLFEQWKANKEAQQRQHSIRGVPMRPLMPQAMMVPELATQQQLQADMGMEQQDEHAATAESQALAKIFEYIRERIVESMWTVNGAHGVGEGVVVTLKGELLDGSRLLLKKVDDQLEIFFYVTNQNFLTMAQKFESQLIQSVIEKCGLGGVKVQYHHLSSERSMNADSQVSESGHQAYPVQASVFEDDDLWGDE